MGDLNKLQNSEILLKNLGWRYQNLGLYEQALTHSSYAHENGNKYAHNERLEFLGDAVLELIISDFLYREYAQLPEGKLTKLRSEIVCEASLVQVAFRLNIGDYMYLGKGEAFHGGASRPSLLADAVEALIGANYLDNGFESCYQYVMNLFKPLLHVLEVGGIQRDYKTLLQEFSQARYGETPAYQIIDDSGPDHDKNFVARVTIGDKFIETGEGKSKKEAEQAAAKKAWNNIL